MYNLRYHIASLVSVFLALALGLVLGGLIVQRGTFTSQGRALVEGLQKEFTDLRADNKALTSENEQLDALSAAFVGEWSADRLAGHTIIIVTNAGRSPGLAAARQAIESAGGSAAVVTLLSPGLGLDDDASRARVASLAADAERPLESISTSLAAEWFGPADGRPLTEALVEAGAITVAGLDDGSQASGLVDIAAFGGKADAAGLELAVAAKESLTAAVAAEPAGADTGVAVAGAGRGLAAFDTLGNEVGRYTLVELIQNPSSGYYGTASGTDALFPPVTLP